MINNVQIIGNYVIGLQNMVGTDVIVTNVDKNKFIIDDFKDLYK